MEHLFNLENPFIQLLSRAMDMILINILFLLCCVPVITIGPAIAALNKVMQDMVYDYEGHIFRRFFKAFKDNFRQSCPLGLIAVVIYVALICDFMLIMAYFHGFGATIMYILLGVLLFIATSTLGYMFPLIIRYQNTLKEHMFNALILTFTKFSKSLLIVLLNLFPFVLIIMFPMIFIQTLVFWFIIGFSFIAFIINTYLRPVFNSLEAE